MTRPPTTPSFRLDGRKALVTGASRGIGFACAAALAEAGASVVVASRSPGGIGSAARSLQDAGFRAKAAVLDVTDRAQIRHIVAEEGPFDVLVNSAGMARHSMALDASEEDYDQVMAVNARSAFFLACEVAGTMPETGGSIIQISSQMGVVASMERAVYCASKHALEGMTKAMAIEWGRLGIRVNTVCPTFIRTELTEATLADPEKQRWIRSKIRLGRLGKVEDVMGAVVFLASDAASLITGTRLLIDGGWTAG